MNSEELELSLRSEFENYLKSFRAEMRQEAADLHTKIEAELDKHRSQLNDAFRLYTARFDSEQEFGEAFTSMVVEHLQIARDEGSKLTANAMAEAEDLARQEETVREREPSAPLDYSVVRDAINDITSQTSQSTILRSLVSHAAQFSPRGAFFIIKNEHLVGWKVFGTHEGNAETAIRDTHIPVEADSILGAAVRSLSTSDDPYGAHADDPTFLEPLNYGQPERMYAIPLVARGRGVAVLYADPGTDGKNVNIEALETLVRIAGLTVELLASGQTAKAENREVRAVNFEESRTEAVEDSQPEERFAEDGEQAQMVEAAVEHEPQVETRDTNFAFADKFTENTDEPKETAFATIPQHETFAEGGYQPPAQEFADHTEAHAVIDEMETFGTSAEIDPSDHETGEIIYDSASSPVIDPSPFDTAVEFAPANAGVTAGVHVEISPANIGGSRLSNRPVDLPIDVAEEERRPHHAARRFARLLVSEIKLYNEKKVEEGRQSQDLYERLREAIDRSREMYDKRVEPPVAAKFDYFHYELVNALAEGQAERLGNGYPGSTI